MSIKTIAGYTVTQFKRINPPQFEGPNHDVEIVFEGIVIHGMRPAKAQTIKWTRDGETILKADKNYHLNIDTVPDKFKKQEKKGNDAEFLDILQEVYKLGLHRNYPTSESYQVGIKVKEKLEEHGRI